jgi:hypothetical protein
LASGRKPGSLNVPFDYLSSLSKVDNPNVPMYLLIDGVGYPLRASPGPIGRNDEADPDIRIRKGLRQTYQGYLDLVDYARSFNDTSVAADNLEHWLGGSGRDRELDWKWLRCFALVKEAESRNRSRFEGKIRSLAPKLKPGEERSFQDYFVAKISVNPAFSHKHIELYYASGASGLYSRGKFYVRRDERLPVVTCRGMVQHHWWDRYDWHAGASAWVPGEGWFKDADARKLEDEGIARAFGMYSFWHQSASGNMDMSRLTTDTLDWTHPVEGLVIDGDIGHWARHPSLYDAHGGLLPGIVYPGDADE